MCFEEKGVRYPPSRPIIQMYFILQDLKLLDTYSIHFYPAWGAKDSAYTLEFKGSEVAWHWSPEHALGSQPAGFNSWLCCSVF